MAIVVYTVEVTMPATPLAVSSGESATLRLPLSIINGGVLQTHAAEHNNAAGAAADMEEEAESEREPQGVDVAL